MKASLIRSCNHPPIFRKLAFVWGFVAISARFQALGLPPRICAPQIPGQKPRKKGIRGLELGNLSGARLISVAGRLQLVQKGNLS